MNQNIIASKLIEAEKNAIPVEAITKAYPNISIEEAYKVQLRIIEKKLEKGNRIVGKKIGLTSKGMQDLLGVGEPDYGHLFYNMIIPEGTPCKRDKLISPKIEGEIAFVLKNDLKGPGVTISDVYRATEGILPAIEIVDSRVENWKIKIQDTIADNGSSAMFVLGNRMLDLREVDLKHIGMYIEKNGRLINSGAGIEVLGNPAISVAWLANKLAEFDIELKAGEIILSGAITAAVTANQGDNFTVSFDKLGDINLSFI